MYCLIFCLHLVMQKDPKFEKYPLVLQLIRKHLSHQLLNDEYVFCNLITVYINLGASLHRRQVGLSKETLSWGWTLGLGSRVRWSSRNLLHRCRIGCLWRKMIMALPPFSMGFHSYPGSHTVWLPRHDKLPRLSPCGEGHCVLHSLKTGQVMKRSIFSSHLLKSEAKFSVPQQWRTAPAVCGFTMKSLSWVNQTCTEVFTGPHHYI